MRVHLVTAVAAPAAAAAGMAVAVLIATGVAVAVAATGRPAELSPPAAMAVQRAPQVAAGESLFLTTRALVIRPRLGTSQLAEMPVHHVMRAGARVGPSGPIATRVGSSVIKRSI